VKRGLFVALGLSIAMACGGSTTTLPSDDDAGGTGGDGGGSDGAASDGSASDGGSRDATGDGQCVTSADCKQGGPDICNICKSPDNHLVCVSGACVCACRVDAG
jgi:hypothetical protein